jgi:hypothetical protein
MTGVTSSISRSHELVHLQYRKRGFRIISIVDDATKDCLALFLVRRPPGLAAPAN